MPTMGTGPLEAVFLDIFVICVVPNVLWNDSMIWGDKTGNQSNRRTANDKMQRCGEASRRPVQAFLCVSGGGMV